MPVLDEDLCACIRLLAVDFRSALCLGSMGILLDVQRTLPSILAGELQDTWGVAGMRVSRGKHAAESTSEGDGLRVIERRVCLALGTQPHRHHLGRQRNARNEARTDVGIYSALLVMAEHIGGRVIDHA